MRKILCLIGSFFCMIYGVNAVSFQCPEVASPGENISCHLEDEQYIGVKAKYQLIDGFSYQNFKLGNSWKSYYDGVEGFSIGNVIDNNKLSLDIGINVGMNVSVNQEYIIQLTDIEASNREYKVVQLDNVSSKIKIVSDINTLDSLEIGNGKLSSKFDKNVASYQATVDSDKINIKAVASDSDAKIEGDIGEKSLNYGANHFIIKVTSVRGNLKEYHLYITRKLKDVKKDSDITLKSLSLSNGKIDFKKDVFFYSTMVGNNVETIDVSAVANSSKAKVKIEKPNKLVIGENIIKVIVTAENGMRGTYLITVERKEKLSSDATIKNLLVRGYDLDFKSDVYEYELLIDSEDKLDIEIELNDDKAKYKVSGNKNLKNNSIIEIKVLAEDGTELIYKIKVIKQNEANSSSIFNYIRIMPLIGFILLIIMVLSVKVLRKILVKKKD